MPSYRWVILGLGFANQGLSYPTWYVFPVFFVALIEEFGWARGPAAAVFSVFVLLTGIAAPFVGQLTDRYGPRVVITLGALVIGVALVGCSSMSELWQFYLFYGLIGGAGMSLSGWISNVTVLSRWFPRAVGAVSGFTSAGIGTAILVLTPLAQARITAVGWRQAYIELALLTVLGMVPANLLLQRPAPRQSVDEPRPLGDGSRPGAPAAESGRPGRPLGPGDDLVVDRDWAGRTWTLGGAARTARFWYLFVAFFTSAVAVQFIFIHQVAYLVEGGLDRALAAFAAGLIGLASIPTKLGGGLMSDRIGRELSWTIFMGILVVGLGLLVLTADGPRPGLAYVFPIFVGIGYSGMSITTPAMVADVFRGPNFGTIFGAIAASTGLGAAAGAWVAGAIYDLTGTYAAAFGVAAACSIVSIVCGWLASPRLVRRAPGARTAALPARLMARS
jgi:MFS family permease